MQNKLGWQQFINLLQTASKKNLLDQTCEFLFTPEEQEQLATRVQITKALLDKQLSQRYIADELQVSIAKITRGSNALKSIDEDLKHFFNKTL
jgi:TrpR family trp operon transcriptional repressor